MSGRPRYDWVGLNVVAAKDPHEGEIDEPYPGEEEDPLAGELGAVELILYEVADILNGRPHFEMPSDFVPNEREAKRIERRAQSLFYEFGYSSKYWARLSEADQAEWRARGLKAVWDDGTLLYGPIGGDDPDGMDEDAKLDQEATEYLAHMREERSRSEGTETS